MELENWVNSIHSACAAAFARHRGKTGTLHLLQEDIYRLEKNIESVSALCGRGCLHSASGLQENLIYYGVPLDQSPCHDLSYSICL